MGINTKFIGPSRPVAKEILENDLGHPMKAGIHAREYLTGNFTTPDILPLVSPAPKRRQPAPQAIVALKPKDRPTRNIQPKGSNAALPVSAFDSSEEIGRAEGISDSNRIARIWEALASQRCQGSIRMPDGRTLNVVAQQVDGEQRRVAWGFVGPEPRLPFQMQLRGHNSDLLCHVTEAHIDGGLITIPFPDAITRIRRRSLRRAPAGQRSLMRFSHPIRPEMAICQPILELSYEGLSCLLPPGEEALHPGMLVSDLEIEAKGEEPILLSARIRHVTTRPDGMLCGLQITHGSDAAMAVWKQFAERHLHPQTCIKGDWNEACWELFERSGYFNLSGKNPAKFETAKAEWFEAQERLSSTPELGYRVMRLADDDPREVEATLSLLKPYAGSWFAHQLARQRPRTDGQPKSGRGALREIYLRGYEPVQVAPDIQWLFAYAEAHVRWTTFTKFDFIKWYEHTNLACLYPFHLMEGSAIRVWDMPPDIEIDTPSSSERKAFLQTLEETRPVPYREALDLVAERLDLSSIRRQWAHANLSREREIFVARCNGQALAIAVMETAHAGLNLFNILDGVHLYPLVEDDSSDAVQAAYAALLGASASWYRARNRQVFVHYVETPHRAYLNNADMTDLGEGKLWVISKQLLPDFIEHLCEATHAPLPA